MSYGPPPPGGYGPPPTGGYPPPGGGYGGYPQQPPAGGPPKNYMVFNIIGIFTCTVVGIIGLVFALQVNSKWEMGDYAGADSSAKVAKIMGIISMVGLALWVLYFLFIIVMVVIGVSTAPTTTGYNY